MKGLQQILLSVLFLIPFIVSTIAQDKPIDVHEDIKSFMTVKSHLLSFEKLFDSEYSEKKSRLAKREGEEVRGPFVLMVETDSRDFLLDLDINKDLFKAGVPKGVDPRQFLKGTVRGYPDSRATITVFGNHFEGYFEVDELDEVTNTTVHRTYWAQAITNPNLVYHPTTRKLVKRSTLSEEENAIVSATMTEQATSTLSSSPFASDKLQDPEPTYAPQPMIIYREDQVVNLTNRVSCGLDHKHEDHDMDKELLARKLSKRSYTPQGVSGSWSGRVCPVFVVADYHYYETPGMKDERTTLAKMISRIAVASEAYETAFNITLAVVHAHIMTTPGQDGWVDINDIYAMLINFSDFSRNNRFSGWPQIPPGGTFPFFCVGHMFTYQDFPIKNDSQPVGLANLGDACNIVNGLGISTGKSVIMDPLAVQAYTIAHEIGHNFDAHHDGDPLNTAPAEYNDCTNEIGYIMGIYSQPHAANNKKFSICSLYQMEAFLAQKYNNSVCFPPLQTFKTVSASQNISFTTTANYTMPAVKWVNQCNKLNYDPRLPYRGQWRECPRLDYNMSRMCMLQCSSVENNIQCTTFNMDLYRYRKDGTVCGWDGFNYLVCMAGKCIAEPAERKPCNRGKPCCDPFGVLRKRNYRCKTMASRINTCQSDYYCDPKAPDDPEACHIQVRPPTMPCNCPLAWSGNNCKGVCGRNENYGKCVWPDDYSNSSMTTSVVTSRCNAKNCTDPLTCVMFSGGAQCVNVTRGSCRYVCDNTEERILTKMSDGGWGCSCSGDCQSKGTCCTDYLYYCQEAKEPSLLDNIPIAITTTVCITIVIAFGVALIFHYRDTVAAEKKKQAKELEKKKAHQLAREKSRRTESPARIAAKQRKGQGNQE